MKKKLLILASLMLAIGVVPINKMLVYATPAPSTDVSSTCETLSVSASHYAASQPAQAEQGYTEYQWVKNGNQFQWSQTKPNGSGWVATGDSRWHQTSPATPARNNTIKIDIDSVNVVDTTFSTSYNNSFNYSNANVTHTYHVVVVAWDGHGNTDRQGESQLCDNMDHKIDICHANNGIKDFVKQNVDFDSILKNNGHSTHQDGRDIIPPFDYVNDHTPGYFNGLNWDAEGQAIYNNDCVVPAPEKPGDIISDDITTKINCDEGTATVTTVTTTIGHELVDNEWVESEPVVGEAVITTREATEEELSTCVVTPEKPADTIRIVTVEDPIDCNEGTVTQTVTTTTTPYVLVDNEWVAGEPRVSTEITVREATQEELSTCKGEILGTSTTVTPKALPVTSGDSIITSLAALSSIGAFVVLLGMIGRRVLSRQI